LYFQLPERADEVFAEVFAVVGRGVALVHVFAVSAVLGEFVAVRTEAAEGAGRVVAAEGALLSLHFQALVQVLARLQRTGRETLGALALKAADRVAASSVAAYVALALIII